MANCGSSGGRILKRYVAKNITGVAGLESCVGCLVYCVSIQENGAKNFFFFEFTALFVSVKQITLWY
jgi:hypothetical protein